MTADRRGRIIPIFLIAPGEGEKEKQAMKEKLKALDEVFSNITSRHISKALQPLDDKLCLNPEAKKRIATEFWHLKDDLMEIVKLQVVNEDRK